jgi:hypothetical protein
LDISGGGATLAPLFSMASFDTLLSVGFDVSNPIAGSATHLGRLEIQASHSRLTTRMTFGRFFCPWRRRSSTVRSPSFAA